LVAAKSRWVVVTGDSIARLFFQGLLRTLGLHEEAVSVVKRSLGYVFHTTADGTPLSVAYIGARYPQDIAALSSAWVKKPGMARVWNNATSKWAIVPQPDVWVANSGLHAMLYHSNDTATYRHALGVLGKRAEELLPATSPFWLGMPSIAMATMPKWKAHLLSPSTVAAFEEATLPALLDESSTWRLLSSRSATTTLPAGLAPKDGIHGELLPTPISELRCARVYVCAIVCTHACEHDMNVCICVQRTLVSMKRWWKRFSSIYAPFE
jgi:hypothetical protein